MKVKTYVVYWRPKGGTTTLAKMPVDSLLDAEAAVNAFSGEDFEAWWEEQG